jgi:short-subunit dehydrogenase
MVTKETALITGATSGIGLHLAKEFASHGHALVLVAPVEAETARLASALQDEHNINAKGLAFDLERPESAQEIFEWVSREGIEIDVLVNNAGFGHRGKFWEIPIEKDMAILRLNVETVLRLTKLFLLPMIQRGRGAILNTASIAAFEPGPLFAIYHASKAFVLSWSEALATELEDTGVTVTALCPGATDTDFFPKSGMEGSRMFQETNLMAPQAVAEAGYKGLMNGDRVVVPGATNRVVAFARRILPEAAQAKLTEQLYKDVNPEDRTRRRGEKEKAAGG